MAGPRTAAGRAALAAMVGGPAFAGVVLMPATPASATGSCYQPYTYYYSYCGYYKYSDGFAAASATATAGDGNHLLGSIRLQCLTPGDTVTFVGTALDEDTGFLGTATETVTCPESTLIDVPQDYPTADGIGGHTGDHDQMTGTIVERTPLGLVVATFTQSQEIVAG